MITNLENSEEFFAQDAARGFVKPKFFAVNPKGDTIFGVRFGMRMTLDNDTMEVTLEMTVRCISQHLIRTGESVTYEIDEAIASAELRQSLEFYMINDHIGILVTYDRQIYQITQFALVLDRKRETAVLAATKRTTLQGLTYDIGIGMGLLDQGLLLVTGSRGPMDGEREVVAHTLPADPLQLRPSPLAFKDYTEQIAEFTAFLHKSYPRYNIFSSGVMWDENGLSFFLKGSDHSILETRKIGRYLFKGKEKCSLIKISNGQLAYTGGITTNHLMISVQRGRHVWLVLTPPDYEQMTTLGWRVYMWCLPSVIKLITLILEGTFRLRVYDGGRCLRAYLWALQAIFGPTMVPRIQADSIFLMYNLDLQMMCLRKVNYEAPLAYSTNLHLPIHPVSMDCDQNGGLVYTELPLDEEDPKLIVRSIAAPHEPASLARLAAHKAYRLFPAMEKSREMRRSLGLTEYTWVL